MYDVIFSDLRSTFFVGTSGIVKWDLILILVQKKFDRGNLNQFWPIFCDLLWFTHCWVFLWLANFQFLIDVQKTIQIHRSIATEVPFSSPPCHPPDYDYGPLHIVSPLCGYNDLIEQTPEIEDDHKLHIQTPVPLHLLHLITQLSNIKGRHKRSHKTTTLYCPLCHWDLHWSSSPGEDSFRLWFNQNSWALITSESRAAQIIIQYRQSQKVIHQECHPNKKIIMITFVWRRRRAAANKIEAN